MTDNTIPAEISAAIAEVKSHILKLAKTEQNSFNRYAYTSVDSFYEAVGPLEAAAGLAIIMTEAEPPEIIPMPKADREGTSSWLKLRWAITIGHKSGATYGPILRTVMVPASGAQAFGSAESYISKQFARCLYRIPTGDKDDADANEKQPLPASRRPRSEFPDKGRRAGGEPVTDAPSTRAAASSPPAAFNWKDAMPEARTKYLLARVPSLTTLEGCAESTKKLKESDVGAEGYRAIMRAITDREKAIQGAQQHATDDAPQALRQLKELFLDVATGAQDLDIAAQTWEETTEPGAIRTRGEELIAARREAIA